MNISKDKSVFLNALRAISSFLVVIGHTLMVDLEVFGKRNFGVYYFFGEHKHQSVIVFFVLSGFVIAHSVETIKNDNNFNDNRTKLIKYFTDRFTRIYLVLIPAILLTAIIDIIGHIFKLQIFLNNLHIPQFHYMFRMIMNILSLQGTLGYQIQFGCNPSLWSIGYEFSYYILFAILVFNKFNWKIFVFLLLFILLKGEKMMSYSIIWFLGVLYYKLNIQFKKIQKGRFFWLIYIMFFCIAYFFIYFKLEDNVDKFFKDLVFSIIIAPFFILEFEMFMPKFLKNISISASKFSYSLYSLHLPIIYLIYSIVNAFEIKLNPTLLSLMSLIIVGIISFFFSLFFESKSTINDSRIKIYNKLIKLY